jgi:hypothetical protein
MRNLVAAIASVLVVPAVASAAVIVVDDFNQATASYPLVDNTVGGIVAGPADPAVGAIGGVRQVAVEMTAADVPGLDSVSAGVFTQIPGVFDFSSTSGADGWTTLLYGASNINSPNLLSLVIPDGSTIELDVQLFDRPAGGSLKIDVSLNSLVPFGTVTTTLNASGAQVVSIPLDSISSSIRSNVTGITVVLDGTKAVDFRLDSISIVVPEPAAMGALAPFGLLLARRRK